MAVLGIETSCDETSAAVVTEDGAVLSNVTASSRDAFAAAGGVIPEEAAREQVRAILPVIEQSLARAGIAPRELTAVAVTRGPGLLGSLIVGTTTARTLTTLWEVPLLGVHHTLGHLCSTALHAPADPAPAVLFPVLALSASGGHTELWLRESWTRGRLLGRTRDDAAGEAFDKGASLLGLPYPGGPSIAREAEGGDHLRYAFPRPLQGESGCDFSFSGLKTALRYTLRDLPSDREQAAERPHLAAGFQHAICRHLCERLGHALAANPDVREIHLVGGVSANSWLRKSATEVAAGRTVRWPSTIAYCTDNGAMIAAAGGMLLKERPDEAFAPFTVEASLAMTAA